MKQQTVGKPNSGVVTLKYTTKELDLLRGTFKDNEPLLKAIKKSLLQESLTEQEEHLLVQSIKGEDLKLLMHKILLPKLSDDVPIFHLHDEWSGNQIENRLVENAVHMLRSHKIAMDYCEQEFENLFNQSSKAKGMSFVELSDLTKPVPDDIIFINFLARQAIVNKVIDFVKALKHLGDTEKMSEDELKDMIRKNSTK